MKELIDRLEREKGRYNNELKDINEQVRILQENTTKKFADLLIGKFFIYRDIVRSVTQTKILDQIIDVVNGVEFSDKYNEIHTIGKELVSSDFSVLVGKKLIVPYLYLGKKQILTSFQLIGSKVIYNLPSDILNKTEINLDLEEELNRIIKDRFDSRKPIYRLTSQDERSVSFQQGYSRSHCWILVDKTKTRKVKLSEVKKELYNTLME